MQSLAELSEWDQLKEVEVEDEVFLFSFFFFQNYFVILSLMGLVCSS